MPRRLSHPRFRWLASQLCCAAFAAFLAVGFTVDVAAGQGVGGAGMQRPDPGDPKPPKGPKKPPAPDPAPAPDQDPDQVEAGYGTVNPLAIANPLCDQSLHRDEARNCELTGTPEARYPTSNYGLEIRIDTGLDNLMGNFQALLAQIANAIWMASLMILNLILTLLGWAFALEPFGDGATMSGISDGLERFYKVFTSPWLAFAFVALGAWAVWRGLVRREIGQTIGGLALSVILMVAALIIVFEPKATVGRGAGLVNTASQSVIAAPQPGGLSDPSGAYGKTMAEIWRGITLPTWSALNLSDLAWAMEEPDRAVLEIANDRVCWDYTFINQLSAAKQQLFYERAAGQAFQGANCNELLAEAGISLPEPRTNAEIWLRSSSGAAARKDIWDELNDDHPYAAYLAIQGNGGAWTRLPLVILIAIGLLGAICLLGWLALRIFIQTAVGFVLLLAAPIALFMPAFGERGRAAFAAWATTLVGAIVSKLVYASLLAVVIFATTTITKLVSGADGLGAMMAFLVQAGLWWAVFLKREQLLAFVSVSGSEPGSGSGGLLGKAFALNQMSQLGRRLTGGGRGRPDGADDAFRSSGLGTASAAALSAGEDQDAAAKPQRQQLDESADRMLDGERAVARQLVEADEDRIARPSGSAYRRSDASGEAGSVGAESAARLDRGEGAPDAGPVAAARMLLSSDRGAAKKVLAQQQGRRGQLAALKKRNPGIEQGRFSSARDQRAFGALNKAISANAGAERAARTVLAAPVQSGDGAGGYSAAQREVAIERIRGDVNRGVESEAHAWRVGMTPEAYRSATGAERERLHADVAGQLRADRRVLGAIPERPAGAPRSAVNPPPRPERPSLRQRLPRIQRGLSR